MRHSSFKSLNRNYSEVFLLKSWGLAWVCWQLELLVQSQDLPHIDRVEVVDVVGAAAGAAQLHVVQAAEVDDGDAADSVAGGGEGGRAGAPGKRAPNVTSVKCIYLHIFLLMSMWRSYCS